MKIIALFAGLLFSLLSWAADVPGLSSLAELKWKNRIILAYNPPEETAALARLKANEQAINERDIIWFLLQGESIITNYPGPLSADFLANTRALYNLSKTSVTLIGKDGGAKALLDNIDLDLLFTKIDAMPMRRWELKD